MGLNSALSTKPTMTAEEYLTFERNAIRDIEGKYELYHNQLIFMAGGSLEHSQIIKNLTSIVDQQIGEQAFEVVGNDLRVPSYDGLRNYFYPDFLMYEGSPEFEEDDMMILTNPVILGEVLSDTTADFDRADKFASYRHIKSFREYILVAQDEARIEHFYKIPNGVWAVGDVVKGLDATLKFKFIPFELPLKAVYKRVNFKRKMTIVP